ncbi:P-selectin glycoprotein ligand 1-like [Cavia porcellus]|uniref:P-selectin glycoprotein ligand 1-like n=1 Tax=Cavia porcellus TaxID=10141 RepID=UPI002FDF7B36
MDEETSRERGNWLLNLIKAMNPFSGCQEQGKALQRKEEVGCPAEEGRSVEGERSSMGDSAEEGESSADGQSSAQDERSVWGESSAGSESSEAEEAEAETQSTAALDKATESETTDEEAAEAETTDEEAAEAETTDEEAAEAETTDEEAAEAETTDEEAAEAETTDEEAAEAENTDEEAGDGDDLAESERQEAEHRQRIINQVLSVLDQSPNRGRRRSVIVLYKRGMERRAGENPVLQLFGAPEEEQVDDPLTEMQETTCPEARGSGALPCWAPGPSGKRPQGRPPGSKNKRRRQ